MEKNIHLIKSDYFTKMALEILKESREEYALYLQDLESSRVNNTTEDSSASQVVENTHKEEPMPKVIIVPQTKKWNDLTYVEQCKFAHELLKDLNVEIADNSAGIVLHYAQKDFGLEVPYLDLRHVTVEFRDEDNNQISSKTLSVNSFKKYSYLDELGLFTFDKVKHTPRRVNLGL